MEVTLILLAAGSGHRFGGEIPKQYVRINEQPLIVHCLQNLAREPRIKAVLPVLAEGDRLFSTCIEGHQFPFELLPSITGGAERAVSMARGLASLSEDVEWVAVHDAVRPTPSSEMLARLFDGALEHGAAVPGLSVSDTIKLVDEDERVLDTLERRNLRAVQTPQVAHKEWLEDAVSSQFDRLHLHTDDASLLEAAGFPVFVCEGDANNLKVTTREDLEKLRRQLKRKNA